MNFSSFTKIALATIAVSFTSSLANADVCPRLNDAVDLSRLSVDPNGKIITATIRLMECA